MKDIYEFQQTFKKNLTERNHLRKMKKILKKIRNISNSYLHSEVKYRWDLRTYHKYKVAPSSNDLKFLVKKYKTLSFN